jgi:uncharacterized protein (UPF0264 family)
LPQLLVSVRSAREARLAVSGGASIIDVKEPSRGSLGRADHSVWREVREAVPAGLPVSVALGELLEWLGPERLPLPSDPWNGISYRKLGLARATDRWRTDWRDLQRSLDEGTSPAPAWIAVAYADWRRAGAPDPHYVLEVALECPEIVGVLVDTWDKRHRPEFDSGWRSWMEEVKSRGKRLAVAGGLGLESIPAALAFSPDIIAVRGAACTDGDRTACIDPDRVRCLVQAVNIA